MKYLLIRLYQKNIDREFLNFSRINYMNPLYNDSFNEKKTMLNRLINDYTHFINTLQNSNQKKFNIENQLKSYK